LDALLYAKFLKKIAIDHGVKNIEGRISSATKNEQTGFIESLMLESGEIIEGDLLTVLALMRFSLKKLCRLALKIGRTCYHVTQQLPCKPSKPAQLFHPLPVLLPLAKVGAGAFRYKIEWVMVTYIPGVIYRMTRLSQPCSKKWMANHLMNLGLSSIGLVFAAKSGIKLCGHRFVRRFS
jgi:hypothetical protein